MVEIELAPRRFALLTEWLDRSVAHTVHGKDGGVQRRRERWKLQVDRPRRTIVLTTERDEGSRALDDVSWIAGTITNRLGGGYQGRIAEVFEDTLPQFTALPVLPPRCRR